MVSVAIWYTTVTDQELDVILLEIIQIVGTAHWGQSFRIYVYKFYVYM